MGLSDKSGRVANTLCRVEKFSPKYRNPNNRSQMWVGRGRMRRWLGAFIKDDRKEDEFAITNVVSGKDCAK
jgi:DNA-binding protein H-NS